MDTATIAHNYYTPASKETLAAAAIVAETARETFLNSGVPEYVDAFNKANEAIHRARTGGTPIPHVKLAGLDGFIINTYATLNGNITVDQAKFILKGRPLPIFNHKTKVSNNYNNLVAEHKANKARLEQLTLSLNECRAANEVRRADIINRANVINSSEKPANDPELMRVMREINARKTSYKNTERTINDLTESFNITRARLDTIEDQLHIYALAKEIAQVEKQNQAIINNFSNQDDGFTNIQDETISEILKNMPLEPASDSETMMDELGLELDIKKIRENGIEV